MSLQALDVKRKTQESFKWSFLGEIFAKLATPLSTMVLARLLAPEIFGIATAVTVIVTFCEAISDNGFAKYIIQKDFETTEEYNRHLRGSLSISLIFSIILTILILVFNAPLSNFVGNAGYELILIVSALQIPFTAINSVYLAFLKREFKFKAVFLVRVAYCSMPFLVTIPLALLGAGPWSLVIGTIFSQLIQVPILLIFAKKILRPIFEKRILSDVFKGSYIMVLESLVIWFCTWISTFLATQFFSSEIVGIVKVSNSTVNSIFSLFSTGFTSILFVSLSRLKNDDLSYKDVFYSIQSAAFSILIPLGIGSYFFSDVVVLIFLGSDWAEASKFVAAYSLSFVLGCCFNNFLSEVFRSKGFFVASIFYQLLMLVVDMTFKFTLGRMSIAIYPYTNLMSIGVMTIVVLLILRFKFKFSLVKIFVNFSKTLICAIFMLPLLVLQKILNVSFVQLIAIIVLCITIYFAISYIINRKNLLNALQYLGVRKK